ncbi:extracellular solute-binding protein [Catenulispora yoronensis]|uniref:Extracellular solute-binding protein n=1 Tax=Catenulispora yoronensis TaxID=450799 RepID=A0ABN2V365_9ACTN
MTGIRSTLAISLLTCTALTATACSGSTANHTDGRRTGPVKIWYSNNPQEVAWGKAEVAAWNKLHPDQEVTGEEIPTAHSSEESITAAISADTAPCLVFNGSPAAVSGWVRQGGLVPLNSFPDGASYIEDRSGRAAAAEYQSPDGDYYQLPWKSNPVMIFYNKDMFRAAGLDPDHPALATYSQFLDAAHKLHDSGKAALAIAPSANGDFYQNWFDFYPLYIAESRGRQLVSDGRPTFDDAAGRAVATFWAEIYKAGLAPKETYNGDAFADQKAAMAIVGPWAISVYGSKVNWGVVPVPTSTGLPADQIHTFADAKTVSLFTACRSRDTAWAFLKFATGPDGDSALLEKTGQMPLRADLATVYAPYFASHPAYTLFAQQAARTVEVPNVPHGVAMWQDLRNGYLRSVVFGDEPTAQWLHEAALKVAADIQP